LTTLHGKESSYLEPPGNSSPALRNLLDNHLKPDEPQYPFHPAENFVLDSEEVDDKGEVGA